MSVSEYYLKATLQKNKLLLQGTHTMISLAALQKALTGIMPHLPKGLQRLMPGLLPCLPLAFEIEKALKKHHLGCLIKYLIWV